MNKLFVVLTMLGFGGSLCLAQELDFEALDYRPVAKAPDFTPDSSDLKEPLVYVFDKNYTEYAIDKRTDNLFRYHLRHHMKYLNDDKAVEDNNKLYLPLYYEKTLENLVVRVYKDGKLVSEAGQSDLKTVELENTEVKLLALKGVSKGCMIETLILEKQGWREYDYEFLQDDETKHKVEFRVYAPKRFKFRMKSYNGLKEALEESDMDRRMYRIDLDKVEGLRDEKYAFRKANRMRVEYFLDEVIDYGKVATLYPEKGRKFFEGMMSDYKKNRKFAKKIMKSAGIRKDDGEEAKIAKLENYIKKTYVILNGFPSRDNLKDINEYNIGSQLDVFKLYVYTLQYMELEYEVILTSDKTERRFDPEFDSWTYLNEPLLYFPGLKKYMDPSAVYARLGRINDNYLGQDGLFIQPLMLDDKISGFTRIKSIPKNDLDKTEDIQRLQVKLTPDLQKCEIEYKREMEGYADVLLRYSYYSSDDEDKKEIVEGFIKGDAEDADVEINNVGNTDMFSTDEVNAPFMIDANVKTSYYIQNAGDKILLKVGELIGPQTEMYSEEPRQQPIEIGFAHKYVRHIVIEIPEGYQAKGLEKLNINIVYNNEKGEPCMAFTCKYKIEGNKLIIDCEEYYADLAYPITQYDDYAKVVNAAADFNKITILIEKK